MNAQLGDRLSAGALFSGIGGLCMGFQRAGVHTSWAVDADPFAVVTYTANFPGVATLERDVQTVSVKQDQLEPVDILHAGFPCQSFSQAGSRRGFEDPRGQLFYEIIRIIREFKDRKPMALNSRKRATSSLRRRRQLVPGAAKRNSEGRLLVSRFELRRTKRLRHHRTPSTASAVVYGRILDAAL